MARRKPGTTGAVDCTEQQRLNEARATGVPWKKWGPYLSERQWGTVREDYSADGNAWDYFTHDQSRSRAYRWGEDGLGGISDDRQRLCFAMALWNEKDPILKERAFGLTNSEDILVKRDDMWDEEDGFYYDVLRLPDGRAFRLKVRSMVGLLEACVVRQQVGGE